ncbi:hypothetical protein CYMTET_48592 [Cymbomonas tetramitiformis]|uniref:Lipase maturation factor 1/2 N-terminal domain-containing protein n=1 Tax=Cymbomonas tetramitiformis TaxID=36881 RepID=A0AAE0EVE8_9CHLO|nr:hypothetical protein CYMTET_48592 [Cymbomonas tetramitiformis]
MTLTGLWLFERCMGFVHIAAYASLIYRTHWKGLFGAEGVTPSKRFLELVAGKIKQAFPRMNISTLLFLQALKCPSLGWLVCSDIWISATLYVGLVLGVLEVVMMRFHGTVTACHVLSAFLYLSLQSMAPMWLALQQDHTIVELGFITLFTAPWRGAHPEIRSAMVAIFTVRVMSACGAVKWFGSPNWRRLTAMPTHYLTQPSPTPLGALAYAYLPRSFHRFSTAVTLILEGPLGPLALAGRRARVAVFAGYAALLAMINLCGNYGFLGLMFSAQCLTLLPDDCFPLWLRRIAQLEQGSSADASLEDTATSVTGAAAWGWLVAGRAAIKPGHLLCAPRCAISSDCTGISKDFGSATFMASSDMCCPPGMRQCWNTTGKSPGEMEVRPKTSDERLFHSHTCRSSSACPMEFSSPWVTHAHRSSTGRATPPLPPHPEAALRLRTVWHELRFNVDKIKGGSGWFDVERLAHYEHPLHVDPQPWG